MTFGDLQIFCATFLLIIAYSLLYLSVPLVVFLAYYYPTILPIPLIYYFWIYWDRHTPLKGGRKWNSPNLRNAKLFKHYKNYFPIHLIKTAELSNDRNYLFIAYPHSTIPMATAFNFFTNCNEFEDKYPGIDMRLATLNACFITPLLRELFLILGACSCSESSIKYVLSQDPSKGILIFAGGSSEIEFSNLRNEYKIIKSRRKGFVRLALQTGTPLVPVFTFGEKDIINVYKILDSKLIKNILGVDWYLLTGRGFFQHHFGLFPRNVPIFTVVGKPIPIPKVENPSLELINEYHEIFFKELKELFEKYKHESGNVGGNSKLSMI